MSKDIIKCFAKLDALDSAKRHGNLSERHAQMLAEIERTFAACSGADVLAGYRTWRDGGRPSHGLSQTYLATEETQDLPAHRSDGSVRAVLAARDQT